MKKRYTSFLFAALFTFLNLSGLQAHDKTVTGSPELVLTAIFIDANQDSMVSPGDNIAYTFSISNNGDENITQLFLTDQLLGIQELSLGSLDVGENTSFNSNYIITQTDIDNGIVLNTASIHGLTTSGDSVTDISDNGDPSDGTDDPTSILLSSSSSLQLILTGELQVIGNDTQIINYTYQVTNTGNATVHNVLITNTLTGLMITTVWPSTLLPGASGYATLTYMVTASDIENGFVSRSASATGTTVTGIPVTDVSDNGDPSDGNNNPTFTMLEELPFLQISVSPTPIDADSDGNYGLGDYIMIYYTIQNSSPDTLTNVSLSVTPSTSFAPVPATFSPGMSYTFMANHDITQEDIDNGIIHFVSTLHAETPNAEVLIKEKTTDVLLYPPGGIRLNAFLDANNNNVKDENEVGFPNGSFHYIINDAVSYYSYPYDGQVTISEIYPANSYDIYFSIDDEYAPFYTVTTASYLDINAPSNSGIVTYDFPVTPVAAYHDLKVGLQSSGTAPRPGFEYQNVIGYTNNGSEAIASGTITFNTDGVATIVGTSEPTASVTPTGFTYNFTDLQRFETRTISVNMLVPTIPTVALGQSLTNTVSGAIAENDILPANNNDFVTQMIVGSWDPNDKTEKHGGEILFSDFTSDDYLTYTIQFENAGTANAVNVKVTDALDAMLDESTVRMVGASAPYVLERFENELTWKFDGIELPPSEENTTIGHGYITFEVKPKSGFQLGDVIPNTAAIYFDFNPAIVTNTFETAFVAQLGVKEIADMDFIVYPNPASDKVTVSLKDNQQTIDTVSLMDLSGKVLLDKNVGAASADITLSGISSGMYVLKIQSEGQVKALKIIRK